MIRLIALLALTLTYSAMAEMSLENEKDRIIFNESYNLASSLLSKNVKDKVGTDLIKFAAWLNPQHEGVKAIRSKLVFGDPVTAVGEGDPVKLAKMIMFRQKDFDQLSMRILYTVVANIVDPSNVDAIVQMKEFKESRYELALNKAIDAVESPKLVDLAKMAKEEEVKEVQIAKQNAELTKSYSSTSKLSADEIDKMLDLIKFRVFKYSEATVCDAINRLTHKLYWRGVQFTLTGNRISAVEENKASNGAIFYVGPLIKPEVEEYELKNKTLRQILDHMSINLDLKYAARDGELAIFDSEVPEFTDAPEEGIASNDLQKALKEYDLKLLNKYRGKEIKMNGIITGIGRGTSSTDIFFAMDGGMVQVYADLKTVEQAVYKRLDTKLDTWSKNGGLKKYRDAVKEAKKTGEEIERRDIVDPMQYVVFEAVLDRIDRGRLVFAKVKYMSFIDSGEFLVRPQK